MVQGNPPRQPVNGSRAAGANPTERTVARVLRLAASLLLLLALGSVAWSAWQGWTASHAPVAQETACPVPAEETADSCALPAEATATSSTATLRPAATFTPTPTPPAIRVVKVMPEKAVAANEHYEFDNCGGIVELHRPFSDAAQVWAEVTVPAQATGPDDAAISVPDPLRTRLMNEIQRAYQEQFEATRTAVEQTEMVAGAYTRWDVLVIWEDWIFAASVSFPVDGITATMAYTYTQHVPKMGYLNPMPCTP